METKTCSRCEESLPASEFYKNRQAKSGLTAYCKRCNREKTVAWGRKNRGRKSEIAKRSRDNNAEALRRKRHEAYHEDIEASRAKCREAYYKGKYCAAYVLHFPDGSFYVGSTEIGMSRRLSVHKNRCRGNPGVDKLIAAGLDWDEVRVHEIKTETHVEALELESSLLSQHLNDPLCLNLNGRRPL